MADAFDPFGVLGEEEENGHIEGTTLAPAPASSLTGVIGDDEILQQQQQKQQQQHLDETKSFVSSSDILNQSHFTAFSAFTRDGIDISGFGGSVNLSSFGAFGGDATQSFDPFGDDDDDGAVEEQEQGTSKDYYGVVGGSAEISNSFSPPDFFLVGSDDEDSSPVIMFLREEMSCIYDDSSLHHLSSSSGNGHANAHRSNTNNNNNNATSMSIEGSIHIQPRSKPFYLSLHDPHGHISELVLQLDFAAEVTHANANANKHHDGTHDDDEEEAYFLLQQRRLPHRRIFRIYVPPNDNDTTVSTSDHHVMTYGSTLKQQQPPLIPIMHYTCSQSLRPIPILVQTKVRAAGQYCRVGIKLRSNPSSSTPLRSVTLLVAVPPGVRGESMKMSRRGGMWDALKRIVVWSVDEMLPGNTVDLQLQFEVLNSSGGSSAGVDGPKKDGMGNATTTNTTLPMTTPRFPVLLQCHGEGEQLSRISLEVGGEGDEFHYRRGGGCVLKKSYRVLHRKV